MGSSAYIMELLRKVCVLIKLAHLWKDKLPCIPGDHTKLDLSPLLCEEQHSLYQQLVGMAEWAVQIGRSDIFFALTSINPFSAAFMEGHLSWLVNILGCLRSVTGRRKIIVISPEDIEEISGKGVNVKDW